MQSFFCGCSKKARIYTRLEPNMFPEGISLALGFFDGIHLGHKEVISRCRNNSVANNRESAVFTFSSHPSVFLTGVPFAELTSFDQKSEIISGLSIDNIIAVDFSTIYNLSPEEFADKILVKCLNARHITCGFNYKFGSSAAAGADDLAALVKPYGIDVDIIQPVVVDRDTVSSTRIRALISEGRVAEANKLLGYPFTICRKVVEGRALARRLGTPTINQLLDSSGVIPKFGVYITRTQVFESWMNSITNVGVRPTVSSENGSDSMGIYAETYILGFQGELYGKNIKVQFIDYLRDEKKFSSIEELKNQIDRDLERLKVYEYTQKN